MYAQRFPIFILSLIRKQGLYTMVRDQAQVRFLAGCMDAAVDAKPLYPYSNKTVKRSENPACHRIAPVPYPIFGDVIPPAISRTGV